MLISFNTKFDFYRFYCWKVTLFKEISDNPLKNAPFFRILCPRLILKFDPMSEKMRTSMSS